MKISTNEIMTLKWGNMTTIDWDYYKPIADFSLEGIVDLKQFQKDKLFELGRLKGSYGIISFIECTRLYFFVPVHPVRFIINKVRSNYFNYVRFKPRAARIRKIKACIVPVIVLIFFISLIYFGYSFMNGTFNPFD